MSLALAAPAAAQCIIPSSQIVSGGPAKDGIPSLTRPRFVSAAEGDQSVPPEALVLGVVVNGEARAYPHQLMWWHEIVNDVLGGAPITVSYCPLTGSGMVYDAVINDAPLEFGVSGLLFDNNLILYDRTTDSLWSQMRVQGICGSLTRTEPELLPVVQSTWRAWKALQPDTTVLSFDTGFNRNYGRYPYGNYDQLFDRSLLFPMTVVDERRPLKELVLGLSHEGVHRAYPYGALGERAVVNDELNGRSVLVVFDREAQLALAFGREVAGQTLSFEAADPAEPVLFHLRDQQTGTLWSLLGVALEGPLAGQRLEQEATFSAMWFAWAAFRPGTEIFLPS
jgi:hypothetical protein